MDSGLRNRSKKRHDSDTAVVQHDHKSRAESEVEDFKEELAEKIEVWREKVHQVRRMCAQTTNMLLRIMGKSYSSSESSMLRGDFSFL